MRSVESSRDNQPIRVLLAEDEDLAQDAIRIYLAAAQGMELVGVARDGLAALRMAEQIPADVAIVDIRMPRMNGIETTRRLVAPPFNLKVLILTHIASDQVLTDALEAGASGFLLKSASPELIQHGIRAAQHGDSLISPQLVIRVLSRRRARAAPPADLSPTDRRLVALVGLGMSNAQIAETMNYTTSTVKTYISRLLTKLGRSNRAGLAALAYEWDLVGPGPTENNPPIN